MFNFNKFMKMAMLQSRRQFLTYSSASMLAMAAGTVFPAPVRAAGLLLSNKEIDIESLDAIDFYVDKTSIVPGSNEVRFEQATDEALYFSHVMFQELMKHQFKSVQSGLSDQLGLNPNQDVLSLNDGYDSVSVIYNEYSDFFSEHVAEYISSLLQKSYSTQTDVQVKDRIAYNSWDMIKVNAKKQIAEKGAVFREIMDRLYAIATSSCQDNRLAGFKGGDGAIKLMEHYKEDSVLAGLTAQLNAQQASQNSFTAAMHKVYNTFHKVRSLNLSAPSEKKIDEETLRNFERMLYGAVYSGLAMSMKWGRRDVEESVIGRDGSFLEVIDYLQSDALTGNAEVSSYWRSFFSSTTPNEFWSGIQSISFGDLTLGDSAAHNKIIAAFPTLNDNTRGRADLFVSGFTMLLSLSHFSWATASDKTEPSGLEIASLGVGLFSDGITVAYELVLTKLTTLLFGNEQPLTDAIVNTMSKFGRFMRNLCTHGKVDYLLSPERRIAEKLFMSSTGIRPIIEKCFVALSALGAAFAAYSLAQAIESGVVADIVFASINMFLAAATFALSVAAVLGVSTGPLGLVIAIVGIIIAIAQWIYSLLHKEPIPPSPVENFTNNVMKPADLIHPDSGDFICKGNVQQGAFASPFNTKTMNTDWEHLEGADHRNYPQLGALLTSKNGGIYYFGNLHDAKYKSRASGFIGNGPDPLEKIQNYRPNYNFVNAADACDIAVESQAVNGQTKVLFSAKCDNVIGGKWQPRLFASNSLDVPPTTHCVSDGVITDINETPQDIAAIHGLDTPMFVIFTKENIYQLKGDTFVNVVPKYGVFEQEDMLSKVMSVVIEKTIHIFYTLYNKYDDKNLYHYTLDLDDDGNYTKLELLQTMDKYLLDANVEISSIVGTKYPATSDNSARIAFFAAGGSRYKRFGTIEIESQNAYGLKETSLMPLYDGVSFSMPGAFGGFYKNAFIPK